MFDELIHRLKQDGRIDILVRVRPHAAQSRFMGMLADGSVKMDIAAPAEDGKGNVALAKLLGELFQVSASDIKILSGKAARLKLVRVRREAV